MRPSALQASEAPEQTPISDPDSGHMHGQNYAEPQLRFGTRPRHGGISYLIYRSQNFSYRDLSEPDRPGGSDMTMDMTARRCHWFKVHFSLQWRVFGFVRV